MKSGSSSGILIAKLSTGAKAGRGLSSSIVKGEKTETSGWVFRDPFWSGFFRFTPRCVERHSLNHPK